ncbi:MAG: biotin--[acetyl-CoA-carboxylase] ligase [Spirochaetaceae bacterium]|jgi:BirA family biotin operon repressor/biotin-[acetyl-CoA-carboxylase] ligase|nr:biotin--[acetyl-CoA-carboxylase] ligase [Spirochaetaceae bacterium]
MSLNKNDENFAMPDAKTSGAVYRKISILGKDSSPIRFLGREIQIAHTGKTGSTMADSRVFGALPENHPWHAPTGSIASAAFQSQGRGRIEGRIWNSSEGENLLCTAILRIQDLPLRSTNAFTLKIGLAIAETFDHFLPEGAQTRIKWPNDVLFEGKKLCGILCESDGKTIYAGTGFNISQTDFSPPLNEKASSLAIILNSLAQRDKTHPAIPRPFDLLAIYLGRLEHTLTREDWREQIEARLFRKGEETAFLQGNPEQGIPMKGVIEGIGMSGELLFRDNTGKMHTLVSGEFTL